MTSEAHHLNSPPPAVSVKVRAKEIEARTQAAGRGLSLASGPPVASQEVIGKRYQSSDKPETQRSTSPGGQLSPFPSRRCSEGDIFRQDKLRNVPPPTAPRQRRVSLENAPLPVVPERRSTLGRLLENTEDRSSGELATATLYQTETTSKFAPFTRGGKSGVTCHKQATSDFSPAIFSTSRRLPASTTPAIHSPLDDIITAFEKICDEFELPESVTGPPDGCSLPAADQLVDPSFQKGSDDVFDKHTYTSRGSDNVRRSTSDVRDKTQWLSEHGIPHVEQCQEIKSDANLKCFETIFSSGNVESVKQYSTSEDSYYESEPIIYRSSIEFSPKTQERHVVSTTLQVSPPTVPSKRESECPTSTFVGKSPAYVSEENRPNIEKSLRFNNTTILLKRSDGRNLETTDSEAFVSEQISLRKFSVKGEIPEKSIIQRYDSSDNNSHSTYEQQFLDAVEGEFNCKENPPKLYSGASNTELSTSNTEKLSLKTKSEQKIKQPNVAIKSQTLRKLSAPSSACAKVDDKQKLNELKIEDIKKDVDAPSHELEIVKDILANLDFEKYKRRYSFDDMDEKSSKTNRAQKSSSVKLKDLIDLFKPTSDSSSSSNKKPFVLSRSSSFTNTETIESDKIPPKFFLQNEERDDVSPLPEDSKKMSTLPRRKSPSRQSCTKLSSTPLVPAVSSCPSIVKLETPNFAALKDCPETDLTNDEGLVSDSEIGPGAYVTAYVSCVTSPASGTSSGRRGHVRSASDNVTSVSSKPEVRIKKTLSTEKLWTSVANRFNGTEKRKRRKGIGCDGTPVQETIKQGTGRSLTYPPQRKCSTSEEEQEYSSVDSNGLKSLKLLTAGLADSATDGVRLLSDLSLADSHLCPSEGTADETYLDVVDSVMQSPNDLQHLSVEDRNSSSGKPHKKKHHSDPGGETTTSTPGDTFIMDSIGSSRSESDLGGNELTTPSSSICSSSFSETSTRGTQTMDEKHHLKLVIDNRKGQGTKHVRTSSSGCLTSGAIPHSSRFQFPDTDTSNQRLAIDPSLSSKSPQEQRRYSKRRLRGPYGEMLEEEMRKSGEKQKSAYSDLSFLQEICETKTKSQQEGPSTENVGSQTQSRATMFLSSQSLDDASSTSSKNDLAMCITPKRKVSANYPLLTDNEPVAIASDEDITPTKPTPNSEYFTSNTAVNNTSENNSDNKGACAKKSKEDSKVNNKESSEPPKSIDRHAVSHILLINMIYYDAYLGLLFRI